MTAPTLKRPTDVEVPMSSFSEDGASYIASAARRSRPAPSALQMAIEAPELSSKSRNLDKIAQRILAARLGASSLPGTQCAGLDGLRSTPDNVGVVHLTWR